MAASRRPTPIATLRQQSALTIPANPREFSVSAWLTAAQKALESSRDKWTAGRNNPADPKLVEDAYILSRRGTLLVEKARSHPSFSQISAADKTLLYSAQKLVLESGQMQPDIVRCLDLRQEAWTKKHGPLSPPASASSQRPLNGVASAAMENNSSDYGVGAIIDGYSSQSHESSPTILPSIPQTQPSPPLTTLSERMAALRVSGLSTATSTSSRVSGSTPSAFSSRQSAVPKPPTQMNGDGPLSSLPPPVPKKPAALSSERSPPTSPRPRKGDLVEDTAVARSGSAPPAIPLSDPPRASSALGLDVGYSASNGRASGSSQGSPRSRHEQLAGMPSPTDFVDHFPSLDDFEKTVTGATSNGYSFPTVPTSAPGEPAPRVSLPPPPRPFEMDTSEFDRENAKRAEAMAKLGGSFESRRTSDAPSRAGASRPDLPPSLVPGGGGTPSVSNGTSSTFANGSASKGRPRAPTSASRAKFNIPFTTEVAPLTLFNYLASDFGETGKGPRVLLLDVRSREEFERGRVKGETVCLEPVGLRSGITSSQIESSLALSPRHELELFSARHYYDMVVFYDRSSTSSPNVAPHSTSSEAQRVLWNLITAIYEREFSKSLQRQPVLLKGGWEAWEKYVGERGIERDGEERPSMPQRRESVDEFGRIEAKKANRKAAIVPASGGAVMRNSGGTMPLGSPYASPIGSPNPSGYFSPPTTYSHSYQPGSSAIGPGSISPRLSIAMPPTAAQRSGSIPSFDAYTPSSSYTPSASYPQHPPQPHINGLSSSQSSQAGPPPLGSPSLPRTRSDFGDLHTQQSFTSYSRQSIDYPQLQPRQAPPIIQTTRPPAQYPSAVPPTALARPPAAQPAPQRSNSASFNSLPITAYRPSQLPSSFNFSEDAIGLTGLKNLGNTCYMNSTIQCLSATIPFARYFKDKTYRRDVNSRNPLGTKGALADAVSELIQAIWAQNYLFLSPLTFRENICRFAPQFRGSDQHDAQEFLGFLLDGLHEDLNYVVNKPPPIEMTPDREHDLETLPPQIMSDREWQIYRMRNDSFVVQCFQGQFRNQLKCLTCGKTSTTYNTFMPLSIPIPTGRSFSKPKLEDCISAFVKEEILDKEDAWFCPRCKQARKASKRLTLSRLPPILVIHLKRFSFKGPFSDKIETQVQYPLSGLDLTSFVPPPLADKNGAPPKPRGYVYDLFGVTNHYGNLSSGHYTAYVRSGRDWNNIGDSKVTPVDPRVVESAKSAYILFLARR